MFDKLKNLLPDRNIFVRSYLYSVGFWGTLHMLSAVLQAIHRHNATGLNALRIANIDAPVERVVDTPLFFIGGWIVFWLGYVVIYRLLKRSRQVATGKDHHQHH